MDSLKTTSKANQAAQEEHRAATKARSSTATNLSPHKSLGARVK